MKKIGLLVLLTLLTVSTYAQKFGHLNASRTDFYDAERDKAVEQLQDYARIRKSVNCLCTRIPIYDWRLSNNE